MGSAWQLSWAEALPESHPGRPPTGLHPPASRCRHALRSPWQMRPLRASCVSRSSHEPRSQYHPSVISSCRRGEEQASRQAGDASMQLRHWGHTGACCAAGCLSHMQGLKTSCSSPHHAHRSPHIVRPAAAAVGRAALRLRLLRRSAARRREVHGGNHQHHGRRRHLVMLLHCKAGGTRRGGE